MAPAVQALLAEQKASLATIDPSACTSTLGSLLRFIRCLYKPFRFFVETGGNTVFFIRREISMTELISNVRGYGRTFSEAYTSWDPPVSSASYQRLLRLKLGGLDCIVRFQCHGYFKDKVPGEEMEHL